MRVNRRGIVTLESFVGIDESICQKLLLLSIESCQLLVLTDLALKLLKLLQEDSSVRILSWHHLNCRLVHFSDVLLDYNSHLGHLYHCY